MAGDGRGPDDQLTSARTDLARAATVEPAVAATEPGGAYSADAPRPRAAVPLRRRPVVLVALALACLPFAVTALRAGTSHFVPTGDNAIIAIRSGDVFGPNSPSLGMPSTLSLYAGGDPSNHPGPMLFWVLAVPYALSGHSTVGFMIGVVALQVGATVVIAMVANRRGGPALALPALVAVAGLSWALEGPSLTEALNPYVVVVPCLALLFLAWDVASGEERTLVLTGVTASLVVQSHISYGLVVAAVSLAGVAGLALSVRRRWRVGANGDHRAALKSSVARAATGTVGAVAVCWAPPLIQQFRSRHPNLSAILHGLTAAKAERPSSGFALAAIESTVGVRPLWLQQHQGVAVDAHPGARWSAALVVLAVLALGAWAWRRKHRAVAGLLTLAAVAIAGAYISARSAPNQLDPQSFRYLWAVGPFVWVGLAWAAIEAVRLSDRSTAMGAALRRMITRPARRAVAVTVCGVLVMATVAAGTATDPTGARAASQDAAVRRAVVAVTPVITANVDPGPLYLLATYGTTAFFTFGPTLLRNLDQHSFRLRVPALAEAYGAGRSRIDGTTLALNVVSTDQDTPAYTPTAHARLVAHYRTRYRAVTDDLRPSQWKPLELRVYLMPVSEIIPPQFLAPR